MKKDTSIFDYEMDETPEDYAERISKMIGKQKDKSYLPKFLIPDGLAQAEYFEKTVYEKAKEKYGEIAEEIENRIDCEIKVYKKLKYIDYVLSFAELINYLKESKIEFSTAGPQCGSIVNYLLGITDIDPLKHGLVFERYINANEPFKPRCPYYFLYVDSKNKEKIIRTIKKKYGKYSLLKPRQVWKDLEKYCYILGENLEELDIYDEDMKHQKKCLLSTRQAEDIGLFVINIYTEKHLDILAECKEKIKTELIFDFDKCDDEKTWEYISSGEFTNPEFEKRKTKEEDELIKLIFKGRYTAKLSSLDELSEFVSIGGFGNGRMPERFVRAYNKDKSLIPQEKLIYQEDCLTIAQKMTKWPLEFCEEFRNATGRHKRCEITKQKFVEDSVKNGYTEEYAREVLEELWHTVPYIRTKSWTIFYAFNLYKLAYISLHYPELYAEVVEKYKIL